jgi:macrolide-specific efflux system membrane fusion protein
MQSYYKREVPVNVTINASDPRLIPDLSASAEVILQKSDDVLAIPLAAVRSAGGRSSVLVREGDQFVDRQVVLGVRDENKVAVVSGLRAGDQVRIGR